MHVIESLADKRLPELISNGAVGVLPTDTVYGIVTTAGNQKAVERLYALKKRERKPGTVIAASIDQLVKLGLKARYLKAVEQYWPGAISVELPNAELAYLTQETGKIAVRIPNDASLQQLLKKTGPLLTSSANSPGEPTANTVNEAQQYFGDHADFYVDGGDLSGRKPSTVIRIVDDAIEVIREGAVKISETGKIEV